MDSKTLFKSLVDVRLASTTGHVVIIEANRPRAIPVDLHAEALARGCAPVAAAEDEDKAPAAPEGDARDETIREGIKQLIALNDESNFTGSGVPKVPAVKKAVGFDVTADEVKAAYASIQEG